MSLSKYVEYIERAPKLAVVLVANLVIPFLGALDYYTGNEISFSIFYLAPISLVTWFVSRREGILTAVFGGAVWLYVEVVGGREYSHPLIPFWNAFVRFGFFLIVVLILARLRDTYYEEKLMARIDYLTGIYNSRAFYELAEKELDRARRNHLPLTLAYIDLDNFKTINDAFGHNAGDDVLQAVAETLKSKVRAMDIVARIGGDEFIILFPETGVEPAKAILSRIIHPLTETIKGNDFTLTFSIGAVTFLKPPESVSEMIKKSDILMYFAKVAGKNMFKYEIAKN